MSWNLRITKPAQKDLEKFPSKDQVSILSALQALELNPFSGDTKRLQPDGWRRRVDSYRILYDLTIEKHLIVVTAIKRRTSTTY